MGLSPKQLRALSRAKYKWSQRHYASNFAEKKGDHLLTYLTKRITDSGVTSQQLNKLYRQYQPLIKKLISYFGGNNNRSDLQQYALITLWSVICQHGVDVHSSIVIRSLKNNLTQAYVEDLRLSFKGLDFKTHRKYRQARKDYIAKYGEKPTAQGLADFMGIAVHWVRHVLIKSSVKFKLIEDHERNTRFRYKYSADLYARKNEYEDRLIYWIDRHWLDGVIKRLDPISASGLNCIMSDDSVEEWAQRNDINKTTVAGRKIKGLWWARALADARFKVSDPRDPRQYLLEQGYDVASIAHRKSMPKV